MGAACVFRSQSLPGRFLIEKNLKETSIELNHNLHYLKQSLELTTSA